MATTNKQKTAKPKRKERQLTVNSVLADSDLGLALEHLNLYVESASAAAGETIAARFAPFAIPKGTPGWQALAIRSANSLENWAKAIREYANLPTSQTSDSQNNGSLWPVANLDCQVDPSRTLSSLQLNHQKLNQLEEDDDDCDENKEGCTPAERLQSRLKKFDSK